MTFSGRTARIGITLLGGGALALVVLPFVWRWSSAWEASLPDDMKATRELCVEDPECVLPPGPDMVTFFVGCTAVVGIVFGLALLLRARTERRLDDVRGL